MEKLGKALTVRQIKIHERVAGLTGNKTDVRVRLDPHHKERVNNLAHQMRMSEAQFIREAVAAYIAKLEVSPDTERAALVPESHVRLLGHFIPYLKRHGKRYQGNFSLLGEFLGIPPEVLRAAAED